MCWLRSVHEQSSVFSSRMNIKIHPTENRVRPTNTGIFLALISGDYFSSFEDSEIYG